MLRLHARGPMTITELARSVQRTHSATSQKVAAMRRAGWVRTTAGPDARTKRVALTARAARVTGRLAAEWRATEAAIAEIEAEIPYPLSQAVADIGQALRRKSFHDRIAEKLARDPAWGRPRGRRRQGTHRRRDRPVRGAAAWPAGGPRRRRRTHDRPASGASRRTGSRSAQGTPASCPGAAGVPAGAGC